MIRWGLLAAAALLAAGAAAADRAPPGYEDLGSQLRAGGEAIRAALAEALPEDVRVVEVEAGYLAGQGLLVIADLANPWYRLDGPEVELAPDLSSLERIPDMVHEILAELNLGLSRREADELNALRGLRDAERAVRGEQRALRGRLRELGRERLRAGPDRAEPLTREIEAVEAELAAADAREQALAAEADGLRAAVDAPPARPQGTLDRQRLDSAVAGAVCTQAARFELPGDETRISVVVRRADATRYYVFELERVRACADGTVDAALLLEDSLRYDG